MKENFSNFGLVPVSIAIRPVSTNRKPILRQLPPTQSELILVLEGSATYHADDQSFPVEKGDIFVILPCLI